MAQALSALPAAASTALNALGSKDGPRLTDTLRLLRLRRPAKIADRKDRLQHAATSHLGMVWAALSYTSGNPAFSNVPSLLPSGATSDSLDPTLLDVWVSTGADGTPTFSAAPSAGGSTAGAGLPPPPLSGSTSC